VQCQPATRDFGLLTSGTHGPVEGAIHMIQWLVTNWSFILSSFLKTNPSTDEGLKLILPKVELLVIVGQHTTVNLKSRLYKPPVTGSEKSWILGVDC